MALFPNNTMSTFKTQLNPPIDLNHHEWEVGLATATLPESWYNVVDKDNTVNLIVDPWEQQLGNVLYTTKICLADGSMNPVHCSYDVGLVEGSTEIETHVPTNYYTSVQELLEVLNDEVHKLWMHDPMRSHLDYLKPRKDPNNKELTDAEREDYISWENRRKIRKIVDERGPIFRFELKDGKVVLRFNHTDGQVYLKTIPRMMLKLRGPMVAMLGWNIQTLYINLREMALQGTTFQAPFDPDMNAHANMFYIYADMVEPQRVGDVVSPLLDVIPSHSYHRPTKIHYMPILYDRLSTIGVYIRNGRNEPIPFSKGKVIIKLHFRRKG